MLTEGGFKTPERILVKFCMGVGVPEVGVPDVVTQAKLGDDRFS